MPGFKNAHTHTAMTFLRSYADDMPLQDWLTKQIFPMEAKLQPDDIYWLSKLGIMEYLTSGITSCFDMYLNTEMMAKASVECGFRSVLVSGINDFSSSLEEVEADFNTYNQYDELIRYCLGFHAEYTCSEELLKDCRAVTALQGSCICSYVRNRTGSGRVCTAPWNYTCSLSGFPGLI